MSDLLQVSDLEKAKLHDTFHSEVITGKVGGLASGADIDFATNAVTGQAQATMPFILNQIGGVIAFDFATGGTIELRRQFVQDATFGIWQWTGALPHVVAPATDPTLDATWVQIYARSASQISTSSGNNLQYELDNTLLPRNDITSPSSLGRDYRFSYNRLYASMFVGISDSLPLDDTLDHFRGLPQKDTWNHPETMGVGGITFGRNGAPFAYLSFNTGHDNVNYGAASFAGGAGCATGNPDEPLEDSLWGYCSFTYGKNNLSKGRISNAIGQNAQSNSLFASTNGYNVLAGAGLASHPNAESPSVPNSGIVSPGRAARAHGEDVQSYGDWAQGFGAFLRAYNGSTVIGSGKDAENLLQCAVNRGIVLGAYCTVPAISLVPDLDNLGFRDYIGLHTTLPRERFEAVIQSGDVFAIRTEGGTGNGKFALQGTLSAAEASTDIFSIEWNSPSTTTPNGVTIFKQNGVQVSGINSIGNYEFANSVGITSGSLFIGGNAIVTSRQAAISNALSTDAKVAAILTAMRNHGLIAV